jgi:hypothetical protein
MTAHAALLAAHATSTAPAPVGQATPVPGAVTGPGFMLVLLAFVAVMVLIGKADALSRLPLALVGAVVSVTVGLAVAVGRGLVRTAARRLGFRWPHWCGLAVTLLLVGQATRAGVPPRSAWTAAGFGWATWLVLRVLAGWRWRRAPKLYAKALRTTAQAMHANARTPTGRDAAAKATTAARKAAKTARPTAPPTPAPPEPLPPAPAPVGIPGLRALAKAHQQPTTPATRAPLPPLPSALPGWLDTARRAASRIGERFPWWRRGR